MDLNYFQDNPSMQLKLNCFLSHSFFLREESFLKSFIQFPTFGPDGVASLVFVVEQIPVGILYQNIWIEPIIKDRFTMMGIPGVLLFGFCILSLGTLAQGDNDTASPGEVSVTPTFTRNGDDAKTKCGLTATSFKILNKQQARIEGLSFSCGDNDTDTCTEIHFTVGFGNKFQAKDKPDDGGIKNLPPGHRVPNHRNSCSTLPNPFNITEPIEKFSLPIQYHFGNDPDAVNWFSVYCWEFNNSFDLGRITFENNSLPNLPEMNDTSKLPDPCDVRANNYTYLVGSSDMIQLDSMTLIFGTLALMLITGN